MADLQRQAQSMLLLMSSYGLALLLVQMNLRRSFTSLSQITNAATSTWQQGDD